MGGGVAGVGGQPAGLPPPLPTPTTSLTVSSVKTIRTILENVYM